MLKPQFYNRFTNFILLCLICFFASNSSFYAQTKKSQEKEISKPISVCELLKNKKKYKNKEILVEAFLEIGPETSTFRYEENCSIVEGVSVRTSDNFESVGDFEKATNLIALQKEGEKKLGTSLRWAVFLRVKIKAKGILQTSNKPKYGHLNSYKHLFLITNVEEIGQSQLIPIGEIFRKEPTIIVSIDNNNSSF